MDSIADLTPDMTALLEAAFVSVAFVFVLNAFLNGMAHWVTHRFWGD